LVLQRFIRLLLAVSLLAGLFACSKGNHPALTGYIEGEYIYLSSEVGGDLIKLPIQRGQQVKQGDLMYQLDPQPESALLDEAKSRLSELKAQLDLAKIQFERQAHLYRTGAGSQSNYDIAQTEYIATQKRYLQLTADIIRAQWTINQKTVYAPTNGQVFDTFFRLGEHVNAGHPVVALLNPAHIRVLFYIPEPELSRIHLNQTITFSCDGCTGKTKAVIHYISPFSFIHIMGAD